MFTAQDFDELRSVIGQPCSADDNVILVALRIAANVMRDGVIEQVINEWFPSDGVDDPANAEMAAAIRKALTS